MRKTYFALSLFLLLFCWHAAPAQTPAASPSPTPAEKSRKSDDKDDTGGNKHGVDLHAPSVSSDGPAGQPCPTVVRLRAILDKSGAIRDITVLKVVVDKSSKKDKDTLVRASIEAAKQIKFTPAIKDGRPVSQYVTLEYCFDVNGPKEPKDDGHDSPHPDSKPDAGRQDRR